MHYYVCFRSAHLHAQRAERTLHKPLNTHPCGKPGLTPTEHQPLVLTILPYLTQRIHSHRGSQPGNVCTVSPGPTRKVFLDKGGEVEMGWLGWSLELHRQQFPFSGPEAWPLHIVLIFVTLILLHIARGLAALARNTVLLGLWKFSLKHSQCSP